MQFLLSKTSKSFRKILLLDKYANISGNNSSLDVDKGYNL